MSTYTPPSRTSTSDATISIGKDSPQSPQMNNHEEDKPQITEGSSRVVMASDGTKDCMALLLTERLITEFNDIIEETRELKKAEEGLRQAKSKATAAGLTAKNLKAELETTEDPDVFDDLAGKIENQKQIYIANTGQQESLARSIEVRKGNLEFAQEVFQNIFRGALEDAKLLDRPEFKTDTVEPSTAARGGQDPVAPSATNESIVSIEELLRRNAYDDWEYTRDDLADAQFAFDNRQVRYDRELMEYQDDFDAGYVSFGRSEFDRRAFGTTRDLTRALIDAEADYADAIRRGQALGVLRNEVDQESNFVSDISDGYHISEEASMRTAVDTVFVEYWNDNVEDSDAEELEELEAPREPDDWDARTVGFSDSISVVDHSRNRKWIDRWRKMCEQ